MLNELLKKQERLQQEMSNGLKKLRIANGFENPFIVARELNRSTATVRNIEEGITFPTRKLLHELLDLYIVTPYEKEDLISLKNKMLKLRRQIKKERDKQR